MILPTLTSSDLGDGESSCWVLWSDASCVYKGPLNQKVPLSQRWVFLIQTRTIVILVHISAICTWKHCISKNHWNFFFIRYLKNDLFFNWRIIALQNFVFFFDKHQHESAIGVHTSPPSLLPPHLTPLGWYKTPVLVPWDIKKTPIGLCILYMVM